MKNDKWQFVVPTRGFYLSERKLFGLSGKGDGFSGVQVALDLFGGGFFKLFVTDRQLCDSLEGSQVLAAFLHFLAQDLLHARVVCGASFSIRWPRKYSTFGTTIAWTSGSWVG